MVYNLHVNYDVNYVVQVSSSTEVYTTIVYRVVYHGKLNALALCTFVYEGFVYCKFY